jgi:hypothetical protein
MPVASNVEPELVVSIAPELGRLADLVRRELPEMLVVEAGAGAAAVSVIEAAEPSSTAEIAARFPWTALLVVNPRGGTPPGVITAHLQAGAAGFLDGSEAELVAAHITAIARRWTGSQQNQRSL